MKKIILFILLVFSIRSIIACDICGCSSGNYFIGPFPQFNKHFIGMRYSFRSFNTVLKRDNTQFSRDFYQTSELLAGMKIRSKWQLLIFIPYNINYSGTDDGVRKSQGLGDLTLLTNYNLLNKIALTKDTETVSQQVWIGGGMKVPTGRFRVDTSEVNSSSNMQPGSGSFDFLLNVTYTIQIKSWGFNSNANYKINQNSTYFKFGNRFNATAFVFRSFRVKNATINPNIGLLYENLGDNMNRDKKIRDTGGTDLLLGTGLETRLKNIAIGCNAQLPLIQSLSGGQTTIKIRGMFHFSFMF